MYKIAAYITAYQDKEAVNNCILSIQQQIYQVDKIFIIDNSPVEIVTKSENIIGEFHPENIGISGGLNLAIKWAIANNYDFLWTFDQDSQVEPDILQKIIHAYNNLQFKHSICIIAPLPVDKVTGQKWHGINFDGYRFRENNNPPENQEYYTCDAVITSGSLISIAIAKQVELPNEKFFIDAVDWEYCLKFIQKNYKIVLAQDIILNHRFGNSRQFQLWPFKKLITVYNYSAMRYYYICRNYTYLESRLAFDNNKIILSILRRLQFLFILTAKIFLFESEHKLLKLWACILGTYHGFIGKLGKIW